MVKRRGNESESEQQQPSAPLSSDPDELLQANRLLRAEIQVLREENAALQKRLTNARLGSRAEQESRRAALNLMEDAVRAKQAEQHENAERRKIEDELRLADRRKDEFLATLAHELRNPLAPIRNSLHILRVAGPDSCGVTQIYEMMERQVDLLIRLVDDLMEVSRITRGKIELRKEPIELSAVIRTAVETSRPMIDHAYHQLAIVIPPEPLTLEADPVRLAQVISNLLNNAAKYTENHGQIWLSVRRDETNVIISVKDNGVGISSEVLPRVFDLFAQGDQAYSRAQGGLGIGLTLARTLIQLHGGQLDARSDGIGRGSEFVIRLPLEDWQWHSLNHVLQNQEEPRLQSRQILVVDDNRDAAESLTRILRYLGMDVRLAGSGPEALACMEEFEPSIVLLDIGMPGMDGIELAKRIRGSCFLKNVVLVALTGWGQEEDRLRTRQAGFDYHLVKPVEPKILSTLLASFPDFPCNP